jgi:hypothetical protein
LDEEERDDGYNGAHVVGGIMNAVLFWKELPCEI